MQSYTVYEAPHPAADRIDRAENLVFVKEGFSWVAALFTLIWMLVHRLWWALLAYVVAALALAMGGPAVGMTETWIVIASLGLNVLCGFEADRLRTWALERRGWTQIGSVTGRSLAACERRFLDSWLQTQPIISTPSTVSHSGTPDKRGWLGFGGLIGAKT